MYWKFTSLLYVHITCTSHVITENPSTSHGIINGKYFMRTWEADKTDVMLITIATKISPLSADNTKTPALEYEEEGEGGEQGRCIHRVLLLMYNRVCSEKATRTLSSRIFKWIRSWRVKRVQSGKRANFKFYNNSKLPPSPPTTANQDWF